MGSIDADSLLAQHVGGGMMMNMNQHNDIPDHQPRREAPPNRQRHDGADIDHAVEENANNERQNDNNDNRARKSGKKARRRNLDQRREVRRQREEAARLGLDGVHDGLEDVEVQRMIEAQIAAENNQRW